MVAAATVLGAMTLMRPVTPEILLVFTFLPRNRGGDERSGLASPNARSCPSQQLAAAVAINSGRIRHGRAIGPRSVVR